MVKCGCLGKGTIMLGAKLGWSYEVLERVLGWILSWGVGYDGSVVFTHGWWCVSVCVLGFLGLHSEEAKVDTEIYSH